MAVGAAATEECALGAAQPCVAAFVVPRQPAALACEIQDVETEIRLHIDDRELTLCPGFYWNEHGCHFVLSKTGDSRYRSMFFYRIRDRFSTGREEYDDIGDCVTTLLKMQADEEAKRLVEGEVSGNS